jgi:hypothetical protein
MSEAATDPTIHRLDIGEALKLTDPAAIQAQIRIRQQLRSECVGWLYPSILTDEIEKLQVSLYCCGDGDVAP